MMDGKAVSLKTILTPSLRIFLETQVPPGEYSEWTYNLESEYWSMITLYCLLGYSLLSSSPPASVRG